MILRQPGVTDQDARRTQMVSNMDLYATILDHAGLPHAKPDRPSRSLLPLFHEDAPPDWSADAVFAEQEETRVIRTGDWVYFKRFQGGGLTFEDALYNVRDDPQEDENLVLDPAHIQTVAALDRQLTAYFDRYADPRMDLWQGGHPIQNSERMHLWRAAWGEEWGPVFNHDP